MRIILILCFLASFLVSCGTSSGTSKTYVDPHAEMHNQMHKDYYQETSQKELQKKIDKIAGTYTGILPCADCEGIDFELDLSRDMSYRSKINYKGKSKSPMIAEGRFSMNDQDIVHLENTNSGFAYFQIDGSSLIVLDKSGKKIESPLSDRYILQPISK